MFRQYKHKQIRKDPQIHQNVLCLVLFPFEYCVKRPNCKRECKPFFPHSWLKPFIERPNKHIGPVCADTRQHVCRSVRMWHNQNADMSVWTNTASACLCALLMSPSHEIISYFNFALNNKQILTKGLYCFICLHVSMRAASGPWLMSITEQCWLFSKWMYNIIIISLNFFFFIVLRLQCVDDVWLLSDWSGTSYLVLRIFVIRLIVYLTCLKEARNRWMCTQKNNFHTALCSDWGQLGHVIQSNADFRLNVQNTLYQYINKRLWHVIKVVFLFFHIDILPKPAFSFMSLWWTFDLNRATQRTSWAVHRCLRCGPFLLLQRKEITKSWNMNFPGFSGGCRRGVLSLTDGAAALVIVLFWLCQMKMFIFLPHCDLCERQMAAICLGSLTKPGILFLHVTLKTEAWPATLTVLL